MEQALYNKWLDPSDFKTNEEFKKAYDETFGRMKAYKEIYEMMSGAEGRIVSIKEGLKKKKKNYEI